MTRFVPLALAALLLAAPDARAGAVCAPPGLWLRPVTGATQGQAGLVAEMAERPMVLLGEVHDDAEQHRWQLDMLAALHARNPNMVIGFEAFPRAAQPVLDRWVAGTLSAAQFLDQVDWPTVWGFPADLYLPLFHFARRHRIPMVALNVSRELTSRVRAEGWAAIPAAAREGVGDPAPANPEYVTRMRAVFAHHEAMQERGARHGGDAPAASEPAEETAEKDAPVTLTAEQEQRFGRFLEAQLLWDGAMAEGLAKARRAGGEPLVVGIIGSGHLSGGEGVTHQLAARGIGDVAVLLPWEAGRPCPEPDSRTADALFGIDLLPADPRPRRMLLGVFIETAEGGGVAVKKVTPDSVADAAGLRDGDVILEAAGLPTARAGDLKATILRQAPGTWLPLKVRRDGNEIEVIARFPAKP